MQHGQRPFRLLTLAALAASLLLPGATALSARPAGTDVIVTVANLRNHDGVVRACMTSDQDRFPRCQGSAHAYSVVSDAGAATVLRFRNVQPGTYAIALLHDENNNGRADRTLGMMPREGFGFSRDARVRMGPPRFRDAAIQINDTASHQTIRMRYML